MKTAVINQNHNRGPQRRKNKTEIAVALVITLLFLSVITFLAVAFLAMTKRDRNAVVATLDVDTAKSMSDAALARAQAGVIAQMMTSKDILSYDYSSSHNYISPLPFTNVENILDVNYYTLMPGGSGGTNASAWAQNIGNLYYDPRPPVFVPTNYAANGTPLDDFRYWVDINRNGMFESNGLVSNYNIGGVLDGTVSNYSGEPEWIGILKYPEYLHSFTNPFVGRYAFLVQPIGKTLDWNFIHNYSKQAGIGSPSMASPPLDYFIRDQGVGSWELNLAALLNDMNTNMYLEPAAYSYNPYNVGVANLGAAFNDAVQIINWRYTANTNLGYPLNLGQSFSSVIPPELYGINYIDEYGLYPTTLAPLDYAGIPANPVASRWPGSYNTNAYYDIQDIFDPTKTGGALNNANGAAFSTRLENFMSQFDSYDRYTFQRMLSCIGTGSSPEFSTYVYPDLYLTGASQTPVGFPVPSVPRTKVNINFDNTAQIQAGPYDLYGKYTPMPTVLTNWTELGFFTNAAESLLRSQVFVFSNWVTNAVAPGFVFTNYIYRTFGVTNIPVYSATNPGIVYNEQIHRMLQMAANVYASAYSNSITPTGGVEAPPVFRPQFSITQDLAHSINLLVVITNFVQDTPQNLYTQIEKGFFDLSDPTAGKQADPKDVNFWGIPWVIGAVKNTPTFDKYTYLNQVYFARKLQFVREAANGKYQTKLPFRNTNQFYELSVSNVCAMDAWNPYSTPFRGTTGNLNVQAVSLVTVTLTNNFNWGSNITVTNFTGTTIGSYSNIASASSPWQPRVFKTLLQSNWVSIPPGYFSEFYHTFIPGVNGQITPLSEDTNQTSFATHSWTITVTNRLYYSLFDGIPGSAGTSLLDFVNLGPFGSSFPLTATLTNSDPNANMWLIQPSIDAGNGQMSLGDQNQIGYGYSHSGLFAASMAGQGAPNGYADTVESFFAPGPTPTGATAAVGTAVPYANYADSNMWMASDPLVHYTLNDLFSGSRVQGVGSSSVYPVYAPETPMALATGTVTQRYTLGAANATTGRMIFGDPGVGTPDAWQFPTNLFPSVGWLGRVHRGTPWQTIYLKADYPVLGAGWSTNANGITGTPWVNSYYTYPTNDWSLIDLFTAAPNDNAARGLLSVNQTNDAAWAAVFSGVIALTNGTGGIPINPTNDFYNFYAQAVDGPAGINATRATNFNGLFHHVGDILKAAPLTIQSPYINGVSPAALTDEMVERIPQQTLSLLKVGMPQFVIYAWGQSLRPKSLYNGGTGSLAYLNNICTNYEITGEYLTRTVCHVVGDPGAGTPKIIVDNFNVEQGN